MDDLAFVREHVPGYGDYAAEETRHSTDDYLRAYVGERLSAVRARFDGELDEHSRKTLDELIFRCQFTDQAFIRWIDHARLDAAAIAALSHVDRELVELALRAETANPPELHEIFDKMDMAFERRREPLPA